MRNSGKMRVILGTMTIGPDSDKGARITSLDEYNKILDYFQAQGYDEIDTARVYVGGKQEAFTASANYQKRGLKIATKLYPHEDGTHAPERLIEAMNKSLQELQTDCVDIWYLHAPDRSINFEETLRAVDQQHKEGKFKELGLSNYAAYEVAEIMSICRLHGWVRPTIYQGMYNAITRNAERELIPCLRRFGFQYVIYNPLAGGLFSPKYENFHPKSGQPDSGRFSDQHGVVGARYRTRYFRDANFDALAMIQPVAAKHDIPMLEVAHRWLLHHSQLRMMSSGERQGNDGIIIGVSSFDQLQENLAAIEKGPLPDDLVQTLDEAWKVAMVDSADYWHGKLRYTYDTEKALYGTQKAAQL